MKPSKQDLFNQYRENVCIEVVQEIARSTAGIHLAFKGGTALKLFYDLPRYSEDLDYDLLSGTSPKALLDSLLKLATKKKWEATDYAVKYNTVLLELRFIGPERNFRLKIEISTRKKSLETSVLSLRGVPVIALEPSFLMAEKIITLVDRHAGRDVFDGWFIIKNGFPLHDALLRSRFGNHPGMYAAVLDAIERITPEKVFRDTGKLLGLDFRNWVKSSFLTDFKRLLAMKIQTSRLTTI